MVDERNARASGPRDDTSVREAAAVITARLCADEVTCDQLIRSLRARGRLPLDNDDVRPLPIVTEALERFASLAERLIGLAMQHVIEDDETRMDDVLVFLQSRDAAPARDDDYARLRADIRRFFLHPTEAYSFWELATLWQVDVKNVRDIYHDEIVRYGTERLTWSDALADSIRFSMLRPVDIERALGLEFTRVWPDAWRTTAVVLHLPRFVAEAVALQSEIPATLPISVRIERTLMELYGRRETRDVAAHIVAAAARRPMSQ